MTKEIRSPNSETVSHSTILLVIRASNIVSSFFIRASSFSSRIRWLGIELRLRRQLIVNHDRHAVTKFEHARADDGLSGLHSLVDRNKVAASFAHSHKSLS